MKKTDILLRRSGYGKVWWTARGASRKARDILGRAPDVTGWVIITMTLDPARFEGPLAGYEAACSRLPTWNKALKRLNGNPLRWARKMELQQNEWPHWHMLANFRKLTLAEVKRLGDMWGLGRVNIEFIRGKHALNYALKYCLKGVSDSGHEDNHGLPAWVLDLGKKARWWQTSRFYDAPGESKASEKPAEELPARPFRTIRERISAEKNRIEVVVYERNAEKPLYRMKISLENEDNTSIFQIVRDALEPGEIPASLGKSRSFVTRINTSKIRNQSWKKATRLLTEIWPVSRVFASLAA